MLGAFRSFSECLKIYAKFSECGRTCRNRFEHFSISPELHNTSPQLSKLHRASRNSVEFSRTFRRPLVLFQSSKNIAWLFGTCSFYTKIFRAPWLNISILIRPSRHVFREFSREFFDLLVASPKLSESFFRNVSEDTPKLLQSCSYPNLSKLLGAFRSFFGHLNYTYCTKLQRAF